MYNIQLLIKNSILFSIFYNYFYEKYELFLIKYLYFNTKGLYLKLNLNIHYSNFSSVRSLIQQKNRLKYYIDTYNKNN
jgi:hypothetical protein